MYPQWHLLVSLAIATASLPFNQNIPLFGVTVFGYDIAVFVLCLFVGFIVDVDHLVDFRLNRGRWFRSAKNAYLEDRWFVVFHGIETAIASSALSVIFPFLMFPTACYVCHLIMDIHANGVPLQAYFYAVRFGKILIQKRE